MLDACLHRTNECYRLTLRSGREKVSGCVCACLIQRQPEGDARVGKLLDVLEKCGPRAFDSLKIALRETGQEHVAEMLTEPEDNQELETSHNSCLPDGYNFPLYSALQNAQLLSSPIIECTIIIQ